MTKADETLRAMAMELAKDSIVTKALAKFLAQVVTEAVEAGKEDLAEALRTERDQQQEFRLQNDREWKAKVDHAKAASVERSFNAGWNMAGGDHTQQEAFKRFVGEG